MFTGLSIRRLRLGLGLFFAALALPTALLVYHAYGQLKWEAYHQYRLLAEELAMRSDRRLQQLFATEEERRFTDYSFLNVAGEGEGGLLQRSPLARFPPQGGLPGLIGYFQIDNDGRFSTPLLPQHGTGSRYGIGPAEAQERTALQGRIYTILSENRLVERERSEPHRGRIGEPLTPPYSTQAAPVPETAPTKVLSEPQIRTDEETMAEGLAAPAHMPMESKGQAAFDQLSDEGAPPRRNSRELAEQRLGRVEELKLEAPFAQAAPRKKAEPTLRQEARNLRKESNVLPQEATASADKDVTTLRVTTFESEIDPFEMRLLDSGHFVLFRKVWRDGARYIQGALLDREPFLHGLFEPLFRDTALAQMSSLALAYRGDILTALSGNPARRYLSSRSELQGSLLYQGRLSSPLSEMELIVTIQRLPAGPGATVLAWLSVVLLGVLCGGLYLLYRLGVGQITLAQQQQDFVSAVSHELKTPLTSIRMYAEMLREGWGSEEKRRSYYDFIFSESERLSRLINNVLQLARMSRNGHRPALQPIAVGELIDMVRAKVSGQAQQAGFTLQIDCDDAVTGQRVLADGDSFSQILINLVDNAIKFSARAERKEVVIGCHAEPKHGVVISVRDYGPGVAREQMKKIFRLFYRSENELTRETVGTGIGLSLVRELAAVMQAEVDLVNRNPGAEFQLHLPLSGE